MLGTLGCNQHYRWGATKKIIKNCVAMTAAGFLCACGTTVDLTSSPGSLSGPVVETIELTSSQESMRLLAAQIEKTAWADAVAGAAVEQTDWMGAFASVLVNGFDEDRPAPIKTSTAVLYLQKLQARHDTVFEQIAALQADISVKNQQAVNFDRVAQIVLKDYRSLVLTGSTYAGKVYSKDVERASMLQDDILVQLRDEVQMVADCFQALDEQRKVFDQAVRLLSKDADRSNIQNMKVQVGELDFRLNQFAELEDNFRSFVVDGEAELARLSQY